MHLSSQSTSSMLRVEKLTLCFTTVLFLLCSCEAFTFSSAQVNRIRNDPQNFYVSNADLPIQSKCSLLIRKLKDDDDDDDDDDGDEYIDDASLGDWRKFRMNLSESGIPSVSSSSSSSSMVTDGYIEEGTDNKIDDEDSISPNDATTNRKRPKSVSKKNEKLLMKQSKTLAEEYISDVWAHESPKV